MKKVIFALALLAAFSFSAKAQEFTPYPYVQLQGGVSYDFGNASFPKLLSPAAQIAVGYQFVDCWSVRLAVNGWQGKHTSEKTNTLYGYMFVQPNVDLVLDWGAGLFGWRDDRPATVYTFFGVGTAIGLENGKAQDLAAAGESFPLLWQPVKAFWNTRSGIGTDIRLTDRMALNFEFDAQFYPESFNSRYNPKVAAGPDFHFALLGGLKFNLGWRPKKAKPVVAPATYQPRNEPKKQEPKKEYREEPAKQQPAEQPIYQGADVDIFFDLNKSVIRDDQVNTASSATCATPRTPRSSWTATPTSRPATPRSTRSSPSSASGSDKVSAPSKKRPAKLASRFFQYSLSPKISVPIRTIVAPCRTATGQSPDIPMDSSVKVSRSSGCSSRIRLNSASIRAKSASITPSSSVFVAIPMRPLIRT